MKSNTPVGDLLRGKRKILIIKTGYSETLDSEDSTVCSLGDVFRTTVLLHLFENDHVTWLTDTSATPLLKGNPFIERILPFNLLAVQQLQSERYDVVVNLEKNPGVCAMATNIRTTEFFGFGFNPETGTANANDLSARALSIALNDNEKHANTQPFEQILFALLGSEWQGERPILPFQPDNTSFDVGLNKYVGTKFPNKAWPMNYWQKLPSLLNSDYSISHQCHLNDLKKYMRWVTSSRILITCDTLGLHLGLAMGHKVIALMGPTSAAEISTTENLNIITPSLDRNCIPCCIPDCKHNDPCMKYIQPEFVRDAVAAWEMS